MSYHVQERKSVEIQQQTQSGVWQTVRRIDNINFQYIQRQMLFVSKQYPNHRVRAVTSDGQLVDML